MATRMQQRRGTQEQWLQSDPVLAAGEIGFETNTNKFKIGNGVDAWLDLPYFVDEAGISASLEDYVAIAEKGIANGVAELDANGQVPASQLGNAPETDLTGYATETYVDQAKADAITVANSYTDSAISSIPPTDLTGYATETYVNTAVSQLVDSAPEMLNTLNELSAAIGDDPSFATTIIGSITDLEANKANANSPTFTGLTDFQGIVDFSDAVVVGIDTLPDQTSNSGKYLTTDGNTASWQTVVSPTPHPFTMIG